MVKAVKVAYRGYVTKGDIVMARVSMSQGAVVRPHKGDPRVAKLEDGGTHAVAEGKRVEGSVKWFNPHRGYGFIIPDDEEPDVLVHLSVLQKDGYNILHEGARVLFERVKTKNGMQASRVIKIDNSTAIKPRKAKLHNTVEPTSDLVKADVKWFNYVRGYGFLTRGPGTRDIFVHAEMLRQYGVRGLQEGDSVLVRYGEGPKGLTATEVALERAEKEAAA